MSQMSIPFGAIASTFNMSRFQNATPGSLTSRFSNLKPLTDFFDFKRMSRPANFGECQSRVGYNLGHFSSNYAVIFLMLTIYSLLKNPVLLFVILLVIGGTYGIGRLEGRDLEIGPIKATTSQLWTALLIVSVPLGFLSSPFSTAFGLVGASAVIILVHAAMLDKPIENAFSEEV